MISTSCVTTDILTYLVELSPCCPDCCCCCWCWWCWYCCCWCWPRCWGGRGRCRTGWRRRWGRGAGSSSPQPPGTSCLQQHSSLSPPSPSSSCRAGWPHLSITRTMERLQDAGGEKGQASMMIYFGIFSSIMLRKNIVNILIFHDVKRQNCLSTKCTVQRYRQETPYFAIWTNNLKWQWGELGSSVHCTVAPFSPQYQTCKQYFTIILLVFSNQTASQCLYLMSTQIDKIDMRGPPSVL